MKLYEITENMAGLQALADTEDLSPELIADTMEGLQAEFSEKAVAVLQVRASMLGEVAMIDNEIERLVSLKKTPENNAKWLTEYLKTNMLATKTDKLDLGVFKVTLRKAMKKLGEVDESKIADTYWTVVPETKKLDKRLLLKDAKDVPIDGVEIVDSERSLQIK